MTMTQIDHRTIIALSSVKGVGPVKLRKMISQIQDKNVRIESWEDLYDFLMEYAPTSLMTLQRTRSEGQAESFPSRNVSVSEY